MELQAQHNDSSTDEPVGLHVLTTEFGQVPGTLIEDLPTADVSDTVQRSTGISLSHIAPKQNSSVVGKREITLNSSFIPENAVLLETPRGLVLTVPGNVGDLSYSEDNTTSDHSQQLLSCIPVSLFSACDTTADVESGVEYGIQVSNETHMVNGQAVQEQATTGGYTVQPMIDETTETCVTTKRKGGWPKGKKRKAATVVTGPRAPLTGYVLYALDRRKEIKESHPHIVFPEVTKILGQEWSSMAPDLKQKYLDLAEEDKKRYRDDLNKFKYEERLQKSKLDKKNQELCQESSDVLDCGEGNGHELYCNICDVYFNNLHNKREHMYGKGHLQNVTDTINKNAQQQENRLVENSLVEEHEEEESPTSRTTSNNEQDKVDDTSAPVDIHAFMMDFIHKNYEREYEISMLKRSLGKAFEDNVAMCKDIQTLQEYQNKLEEEQKALNESNAALLSQSDNLKMVPTLFGIVNL